MAEAMTADRDAYARFFGAMLDRGILLPPSQFEAWFLSTAHDDAVIDEALDAAATAFDVSASDVSASDVSASSEAAEQPPS
jgi:glutamate-1-semialdehyde 2,1-aminomutase